MTADPSHPTTSIPSHRAANPCRHPVPAGHRIGSAFSGPSRPLDRAQALAAYRSIRQATVLVAKPLPSRTA